MERDTIKGVWGFNGTERPGAVYLASVLATHAQKGLPAFGIYGHDVQNADERSIPDDVREKLLRFARAAVAAATMRGKSYLQIGSICMGIGGSIIDPAFIEEYLGMRVESVDEVEIIRRMSEGIYDEAEYERALAVERENAARSALTRIPAFVQASAERTEEDFAFVVKMMCIIKDLMNGNPNLRRRASKRKASATTPSRQVSRASASGRTSTRTATSARRSSTRPSTGTARASRTSSRRKTTCSTGSACSSCKLLTNTRADLRRRAHLLEPRRRCERATGYEARGHAPPNRDGVHPPHQLRRRTASTPRGEARDEIRTEPS